MSTSSNTGPSARQSSPPLRGGTNREATRSATEWRATLRTDRRAFLKAGSAGLLGLTLADLLRAEAEPSEASGRSKAKGVILIWLGGGPATIDMWDMKPEAAEEIRGEFKPIATAATGIHICEHLPGLAKVMDRCALVRSLNHSITAHDQGAIYMATGHPPSFALKYPAMGPLANRLLPSAIGMPSAVTFDRGGGFPEDPGYLGSSFAPFTVEGATRGRGGPRVEGVSLPDGFTRTELENREKLRTVLDSRFRTLDESDLPAGMDKFQQQALDVLRSDRVRQAFDISKEKEAVRTAFGPSPLGQSAIAARRLIEAGARFVTLGLNGWDTHAGNFQALRLQLLPVLDRVLAALVSDLSERGLLGSTLIYCAGEFGRTPRVNSAGGRDHWARAMAVFLAGGGIRGGTVYGSTDCDGAAPETDACSPADVSATIFHLLGVEPTYELKTSSGRPVPLFREGKVLHSLIG